MVRLPLLMLRWSSQFRNRAEQLWDTPRAGFYLFAAFSLLCAYFFGHVPPPGYAATTLGVVAALMAARTKASGVEKAGWMVMIGVLLFVEAKAIRKDRAENEAKQERDRGQQKQSFIDIGEGIRAAIKQNQDHFDATTREMNDTLKTAEATLKNTTPYALLEFQEINPYVPSFPMRAGGAVTFNISFINDGSETAQDTHYDAKLYVRRPESIDDQKEIAAEFDTWWSKSRHRENKNIRIRFPMMFTINSPAFTEDEVKSINNKTSTLYFLTRFTWKDRTGNWVGDECFMFRDPTHDLVLGDICTVHNNPRYRIH
jgi:hypothetical protein